MEFRAGPISSSIISDISSEPTFSMFWVAGGLSIREGTDFDEIFGYCLISLLRYFIVPSMCFLIIRHFSFVLWPSIYFCIGFFLLLSLV